jgi:hypothetical protein
MRQARRRTLWNLAFRQFAWAACIALIAFNLLLLAGTRILAWYWPCMLLLGGTLLAFLRLSRRQPSPYQVAQSVDKQLDLKDLLSSAYHFSVQSPPGNSDSEFRRTLSSQAEAVAEGLDVSQAIPFSLPRSVLVAGILLLVAGGLLFLRYGVLKTLALNAPLVQIRFDPLAALSKTALNQPAVRKAASQPDAAGDQNGNRETYPFPEDALQSIQASETTSTTGTKPGESKQGFAATKDSSGTPDELAEASAEGNPSQPSGNTPSPNGENRPPAPSADPPKSKPPDSGSLMDKMRDALASVMDKLRQQQNSEGKPGSSPQSSSEQQAAEQGMPSPGKGKQGEAGDQQKADPSQQGSESQQSAKSQQPGSEAEQNSNESKSGMGRQEGRKDAQLAEQMQAMGKISEILGKRSQSVQGEMSVEVQATRNQGVQTPYLQRQAAHAEAGGEIGRDEIPLHLQPYVQKYYEQIRKSAPPSRASQ